MGLLDTIFKDFRFSRDGMANCYVRAFNGENNEVEQLDQELMDRYIKGQSIVDIIKGDLQYLFNVYLFQLYPKKQ